MLKTLLSWVLDYVLGKLFTLFKQWQKDKELERKDQEDIAKAIDNVETANTEDERRDANDGVTRSSFK